MKTFIAKPVVVPSNMAEMIDEQMGQPKGFTRNLIADSGNLHELDEELLAIGLISMVKGLIKDKDLPDEHKPLSIERLSNVIYVAIFSYCIGTMRVDEDGDVSFGQGLEDAKKALELKLSKRIKFANGRSMPTDEFLQLVKVSSAPSSIKKTYERVVQRHGISRDISPRSAFAVAKSAILTAKDLIAQGK